MKPVSPLSLYPAGFFFFLIYWKNWWMIEMGETGENCNAFSYEYKSYQMETVLTSVFWSKKK